MTEHDGSGSRDSTAENADGGSAGEGWPAWLCETVETVHGVLDRADTAAELGTALPDALAANPSTVFAWVGAVDDTGIRVRGAPSGMSLPSRLTEEPGQETLTGFVEPSGEVEVVTESVPEDARLALGHTDEHPDRVGSFLGIPLQRDGACEGVLHLYITDWARNHEAVLSSLGRAVGRQLDAFDTAEQLARERRRLESTRSLLSHDLGNPLNIASGRVELARADDDTSHLDSVNGALDRMDDLLDRGVHLVEVGQQPVETEQLSLAALAHDSWDDVGRGRGDLRVEDARLRGEREPVRILLNELFRNALVHSDGPVTVEVGPLDEMTGFFVADDGPGIPEDEREYVLDTGYTTAPDRDGLGLSVVTEIAGAHGWDVALDASDSGGTRVEVVTSRW